MSKFKDWVMDNQELEGMEEKKLEGMEEKIKLITDYMSKCPFIEFHEIVDLNGETATIDIAFDDD